MIEKKWIVFQILTGLSQAHFYGIYHGGTYMLLIHLHAAIENSNNNSYQTYLYFIFI